DVRAKRAEEFQRARKRYVPREVSARDVASAAKLQRRLDAEGDGREGREAIEEDLSRSPLRKPARDRFPHDRELFPAIPAGDRFTRRSRRFVVMPELFARHRDHVERSRSAKIL